MLTVDGAGHRGVAADLQRSIEHAADVITIEPKNSDFTAPGTPCFFDLIGFDTFMIPRAFRY